MNCDESRLLISRSLDGEASDLDEAQLHAHLGNCPACRAFLRSARTIDAALHQLGREPAGTARLFGFRAPLIRIRWGRKSLKLSLPAAAMIAVAFIAGLLWVTELAVPRPASKTIERLVWVLPEQVIRAGG